MKVNKILVLMMLFWSHCLFAQERKELALIPKPAELVQKEGTFRLSDQTKILAKSADAKRSAELFHDFLQDRYGIKLKITPLEESRNVIVIDDEPEGDSPEAYELNVSEDKVQIKGGNSGVFYGLQSLLQLISVEDGALKVPAVAIKDAPEFGYRGLMLDVSRHYFSLDQIKKIVDLMAYFKFNKLHWHLTEDQGWRLEIKKYPKLTEISAWRDSTIIGRYGDFKPFVYDGEKHGGYYTQEEARELVKYAADRKITIIPEIEMPGHSSAVLAAYPELGCMDSDYEYTVKGYWGVHKDIFCPKEETFRFLEDVLTEVMDIFPSEYIHIGGDEVPKDHWEQSAQAQKVIKKNKLKDEHELQSFFIRRIEKFLNKHNRNLVGWDEILEGGLAPNATVMSWRGEKGGIAAAKMGHDVIMTPNSHLYLDHYQAEDIENEPAAIGGFLPLEKVYSYYPLPESLNAQEQKHVLGVQANLWTEYIGSNNKMEYMLFPRILALSEVAWTDKNAKNFTDFSQNRLPKRLAELEKLGVNFRIPEARVEVSSAGNSDRKEVSIIPFVSNSEVYYTIDGHKVDRTANKYTGPFKLPIVGPEQGPLELRYIIVTPDNRSSRMFKVTLD
jgi:hexosaminidase